MKRPLTFSRRLKSLYSFGLQAVTYLVFLRSSSGAVSLFFALRRFVFLPTSKQRPCSSGTAAKLAARRFRWFILFTSLRSQLCTTTRCAASHAASRVQLVSCAQLPSRRAAATWSTRYAAASQQSTASRRHPIVRQALQPADECAASAQSFRPACVC